MNQSKLISCLQKLSARERNQFRDFVDSPYFNKHQATRQLYYLILSLLQKGKQYDRKTLFTKLYPKSTYEEGKINVLLSYLMGLLEKFLGQKEWESNIKERAITEMKGSQKRDFDRILLPQYKKLQQHFQAQEIKDSQHYYQLARSNEIMDTYYILKGDRKQASFLQDAVDNFDRFYLSERLRYSCDMLSRMNIINEEFDLGLLNELLNYLNQNKDKYQGVPSIAIYYQVLMTLKESNEEEHYQHLIQLLEAYSQQFTREEAQGMYDYAQNYCIRKINAGNSHYQKEIFKLYNQQIKKDLLKQNGQLSEWDYKNIVTVGCRLNAFEWTQNFIEQNKIYLGDHCRDNAYNYNLASFYYARKDFNEALSLLQNVSFRDPYYHLGAKFIQTKIYFEQEEWSALYALLDTFKIYLLRHKNMAKEQRQAPLNFIRFTLKLAKIKEKLSIQNPGKSKIALEKLKLNIDKSKVIVNVNWLLDQIEDCQLRLASPQY